MDLCYDYAFSKKLAACDIHSDLSPQPRYLQLAVITDSRKSLELVTFIVIYHHNTDRVHVHVYS